MRMVCQKMEEPTIQLKQNGGKVPANQALVYAFSNDPDVRARQDIGLDGLSDAEEAAKYPLFAGLDDPAGDNYEYYLQARGDVLERYLNYNGTEGNLQ